jgi:hypothetical protein
MKEDDQTEFESRRETGEIYMLSKKERILMIEILKLTLVSRAPRHFLVKRFGKEGVKIAANLLA